jgi:hypothetical protein
MDHLINISAKFGAICSVIFNKKDRNVKIYWVQNDDSWNEMTISHLDLWSSLTRKFYPSFKLLKENSLVEQFI